DERVVRDCSLFARTNCAQRNDAPNEPRPARTIGRRVERGARKRLEDRHLRQRRGYFFESVSPRRAHAFRFDVRDYKHFHNRRDGVRLFYWPFTSDRTRILA